MSSQKGNDRRTRPQKHQNRTAFKNDRYDTNIRTKRLNETQIHSVCMKCKSVLEWKIKYKKYKPLKTPRSCNKCHQKTVKQAYHTICPPCSHTLRVCPKCEVPMSVEEVDHEPTILNQNLNFSPSYIDNENCPSSSDNEDAGSCDND